MAEAIVRRRNVTKSVIKVTSVGCQPVSAGKEGKILLFWLSSNRGWGRGEE